MKKAVLGKPVKVPAPLYSGEQGIVMFCCFCVELKRKLTLWECPFSQAFIQSGCLGNCIHQCSTLWSEFETGGVEQDPTTQCIDCPQPSPSCAANAKCYPGAQSYTGNGA